MKVSVIVPVYNVEPYLRRCLDSLVNQTLKEIEIICINDCSPDNSLTILKKYAKKDNRIKIINFEKNQGVSVARNAGMKIAKGEYIGFCDSDDYVDLDFYEKLYKLAKEKNADIAKGDCKMMDVETGVEFIANSNANLHKHKCHFTEGYFWTAIYRESMLKKHSVIFPINNVVAEDICFLNYAVIVAENVSFFNHTYYHYVRRENSLDSKFYNNEKINSFLYCCNLVLNRLNSSAIDKLHYLVVSKSFFYLMIHFLQRTSDKELHKKIAKSIIYFYRNCKFQRNLRLPKNVTNSIEKEDEILTLNLLEKWRKCNFYPAIHLSETVLQNRKLYVWGAGKMGLIVKEQCEDNGWKIAGFLDLNKNIKDFEGYKVKRPKSILNRSERDFFIIISSMKYWQEIAKICKEAGLKTAQDFWRPK